MTEEEEFIPVAVAAEITGPLKAAAEVANSLFGEFLSSVSKDCVKAGSKMIGHIKANVRSGNELLSMSSTTDDGNVRSRSVFTDTVNGYSMTVNVIVYGLDRYEVARILSSNAGKMLGTVPKIYSELGCEDPECGDPMCRNADHRRIIDIK